MPIGSYFGGRGKAVMARMKKKHGEKGGERSFHAAANKQKKNPFQALRGK